MTVGTPGNDTLQNDPSVNPELVDALAGDDRITIVVPARTGGSTITVEGDEGMDILEAQAQYFSSTMAGSFRAHSSAGYDADVIYSGIERLVLTGGIDPTASSFVTGDTADWLTINSTPTNVTITTGGGNDRLIFSGLHNNVDLNAGSGDDLIDFSQSGQWSTGGNPASIRLRGGEGDDRIIGTSGYSDGLYGDAGNDYFVADTMNSLRAGDRLHGGTGDDTYEISGGDETIIENAGEGVDTVRISLVGFAPSLTYTLPDNVENMIDLTMEGGYNVFNGNALNNVMIDMDDRPRTFRVHQGGEDNVQTGGGDDIVYMGSALSAGDQVDGGAGTDQLVLQGSQTVQLGSAPLVGIEQLVLLAANDATYQNAGPGLASYNITMTDTALSSGRVLFVVASGLRDGENVTFDARAETDGAYSVYTGAGDDTLYGGARGDLLSGGLGSDLLFGGGGNDVYQVDGSDAVYETTGEGNDRVLATTSFSLGAGTSVEFLGTIDSLATTAINLYGNELAQRIVGNAGNNALYGLAGNDRLEGLAGIDYLDGGAGNDTMVGGTGGDIYRVDSASDTLIEAAGEGSDSVYTSVSYALDAGVEIELFGTNDATGTTALVLTGNEFNQQIVGNAGNNVLRGGGGTDYLYGLAGSDTLDGGTGNDLMEGGADDDRYYVDSAGDLVVEMDGEGYDYVYSSVSYSLTDDVHVEVIATTDALGTEALTLGGNAHNNTVIGNAGGNLLYGFGGADYLLGLAGNDRLDGGTGADIMEGGTGNDRYYVDTAGDIVRELAGEGTDLLYSSVSYGLAAGAQVEQLSTQDATGTEALTLAGNEFSNSVIGNAGNNALYGYEGADSLIGLAGNDLLDGGAGRDIMEGGMGDDSYYVDTATEVVREASGEGYDYVYTSVSYALAEGQAVEVLGTRNAAGVEAIALTGNSGGNDLIGNAGANVLLGLGGADYFSGLGGNDTLDGGAGQDYLTGGAGADTFRFSAATDSGIGGAADRISDFLSGTDKIDLSWIDADTTAAGDQAFTFAGTNAFSGDAGELRYEQVGGEIYLFGDVNGDSTADFQITLVSPMIVQGDFML